MSVLAGAVGAGLIMAAIGHEMSLKREAERINAEIDVGERRARVQESMAREDRLRAMRDISRIQAERRMMERGIVPMSRGRAADAIYASEMARDTGGYGWD